MVRNLLNWLLVIFYSKANNVSVENCKNISFKVVKSAGEGCKFLEGISISSNVSIGRYTSISGPSTRIASKINKIKIGSFCSIASGVVVQEYYHKYNRVTSYYIHKNIFKNNSVCDIYSKGEIIIEDDVWIGSNCVILSGVTIGRGSVIGAGSVVTKNIPKYSIVGGNPAKIIRKRFNVETIECLENLKWWLWARKKLEANQYFFALSEDEIVGYRPI